MGKMFKKPKPVVINAGGMGNNHVSKVAEKQIADLEKKLELAESPTAMPDEGSESVKRSRLKAIAEQAESSGSEATNLTGNKLGDASKAVGRRGRIVKSSMMSAA
jgi:uncharacterized protein YbcI